MNERPFYLHLEGMDLAGKSSLCRRLCAGTPPRFASRHNSLSGANPIYALADRLRRENAFSAETLGQLFAAALAADLERFAWPQQPTIQDSTLLLRSLAYHTVAGTPGVPGQLETLLTRHPRFDLSIVLTADRPSRLLRLAERRRCQPAEIAPDDLLVETQPECFDAMERKLVQLARVHFNAHVIDTSALTADEVLRHVSGFFPLYVPVTSLI